MQPDPTTRFLEALRESLQEQTLVKITLGAPCGPDPTLRKVRGRPVQLRAGPRLQLVWRHEARDLTHNHPHEEGVAQVAELLGTAFGSGHLFTLAHTLQLQRRGERWRLRTGPPQHDTAPDRAHDRDKERPVALDPAWMRGLGVLDRRGRPKRGMESKRRQILRFVEILDHMLRGVEPTERGLSLVDMGCGRGSLTFAAYQLLIARAGPRSRVLGVERRPELVQRAAELARRVGYDGLSFAAGHIDSVSLDGVVALHACDTATDDALARGIEAGARWLVVAPCCHQQVRPQLTGPELLQPVLRHGILRTRQAEIATDALRAALLEAVGYRARVLEFIGAEHTDKNLLIIAARRADAQPGDLVGAAVRRVQQLARAHGIVEQRLAEHLGVSLEA